MMLMPSFSISARTWRDVIVEAAQDIPPR